ncbi:MAG: hypothetical protein LKG21_04140 [Ruminococcus sp.]|nr:hypothetical protein [Ruminococcus sp.]
MKLHKIMSGNYFYSRIKLTVLMMCTVFTLGSCSFGTSIDNLMAPPKLSVEQEQIYDTLKSAAGQNISLKYPKSGPYLSAFITEDIDGDGGNEAIVFYEKTGLTVEENTLRINVLDKFNNKWRSVCDTPAQGSEIEKVMISRLGTNNRINIIIGSSLINRSEKSITIYNYIPESGLIEKSFSSTYSFVDVTDLDSDKTNELLILRGGISGAASASASAYKLNGDGKYQEYKTDLNGSFNEFDQLVYGKINDTLKGLYIDALSGTGTIQTDIIYMDSSGLKKVFASPEECAATSRPSGCATTDIDGDGIYEIPVQRLFPGYSDKSESEQIKKTDWMYLKDGKMITKYSSYFSVTEGYAFIIPEKWRNKVTVKRDSINDETVFCKYENNTAGAELLRIFIAKDSASREDRLSAGYYFLHSRGDACYLAYPVADEKMGLTAGELALYFKFVD